MSKTKTVYQTAPNGAYLYETIANELPLSPGDFNVPYGAVEVAPPVAPAGQVAQWQGNVWAIVADNRGAALYRADSGEQYVIDSVVEVNGSETSYNGLGAIPAWLTETAPVTAETN
ncbi:phage tail protein [Paraburkholderia saeva]|uniref:Phage tail protein n=1 Tax=Paraburkholderia saeva TaxID=2777537 RepID=A0A9N8X2V0_9BURK|nr:phage tail protein [Paraburkholderia saeva]CAG4905986.1 hypothetical protein LMG31841_03511 [Paraburkholderia saeva]